MGYKLLTRDMKTRKDKSNEMGWSDIGEWHEATGSGGLCTNGVLHDYDDPWIAVMMNPAHANIGDPVMYETERSSDTISDGLKSGSKRMRLLGPIDLPDIPLLQKVAFGILSSLEVYFEEKYVAWAMDWLSGKDRTARSAATGAAYATRSAAYGAAYAARSADNAYHAATFDSYAAYATSYAAYAADAARTAIYGGKKINWNRIKTKAMKIT